MLSVNRTCSPSSLRRLPVLRSRVYRGRTVEVHCHASSVVTLLVNVRKGFRSPKEVLPWVDVPGVTGDGQGERSMGRGISLRPLFGRSVTRKRGFESYPTTRRPVSAVTPHSLSTDRLPVSGHPVDSWGRYITTDPGTWRVSGPVLTTPLASHDRGFQSPDPPFTRTDYWCTEIFVGSEDQSLRKEDPRIPSSRLSSEI